VLRARPLPASAQLLPAVLLCAAFLVTLPVLPFQSWLIRAFVAGPREVALLLGAGLSSVALYAVMRLCVGLFPQGMSVAAPAFLRRRVPASRRSPRSPCSRSSAYQAAARSQRTTSSSPARTSVSRPRPPSWRS